jgi:hypothetical protein
VSEAITTEAGRVAEYARVRGKVREMLAVTDEDPALALALFHALGGKMSALEFPRAYVEPITDDGETYEGLRCPWCSVEIADDGLTIVDWATTCSSSSDVNAPEAYHAVDYDHEPEMETLHYQCEACTNPISLPEGWTEQ